MKTWEILLTIGIILALVGGWITLIYWTSPSILVAIGLITFVVGIALIIVAFIYISLGWLEKKIDTLIKLSHNSLEILAKQEEERLIRERNKKSKPF